MRLPVQSLQQAKIVLVLLLIADHVEQTLAHQGAILFLVDSPIDHFGQDHQGPHVYDFPYCQVFVNRDQPGMTPARHLQ
jgi:hypothetical protein